MLSNSKVLFSELSQALLRAAMYISYADLTGGKKAQHAEINALSFLMQLLQQQNSEDSLLHDLAKLSSGELTDVDYYVPPSEEEMEELQADLQNVPLEVENAVKAALNNFSKSEARLYADMLVASGASVAQAYDELDDFFLTGSSIVNWVTFITNAKPLYHRLLMSFSKFHANENAKYLYESDDLFDEIKISTKEADALGELTSAVRKAWLEKYPEDLEQTVEDYIRENESQS